MPMRSTTRSNVQQRLQCSASEEISIRQVFGSTVGVGALSGFLSYAWVQSPLSMRLQVRVDRLRMEMLGSIAILLAAFPN